MERHDLDASFEQVRDKQFERDLTQVVEDYMDRLGRTKVGNEVILRYVTHRFARQLDELAGVLIRPKNLN